MCSVNVYGVPGLSTKTRPLACGPFHQRSIHSPCCHPLPENAFAADKLSHQGNFHFLSLFYFPGISLCSQAGKDITPDRPKFYFGNAKISGRLCSAAFTPLSALFRCIRPSILKVRDKYYDHWTSHPKLRLLAWRLRLFLRE